MRRRRTPARLPEAEVIPFPRSANGVGGVVVRFAGAEDVPVILVEIVRTDGADVWAHAVAEDGTRYFGPVTASIVDRTILEPGDRFDILADDAGEKSFVRRPDRLTTDELHALRGKLAWALFVNNIADRVAEKLRKETTT